MARSNLPPGCTDAEIERQFTDPDEALRDAIAGLLEANVDPPTDAAALEEGILAIVRAERESAAQGALADARELQALAPPEAGGDDASILRGVLLELWAEAIAAQPGDAVVGDSFSTETAVAWILKAIRSPHGSRRILPEDSRLERVLRDWEEPDAGFVSGTDERGIHCADVARFVRGLMSERDRLEALVPAPHSRLGRAWRDVVLEASEEELREAFGEEQVDRDIAAGREVIRRALESCGYDPDTGKRRESPKETGHV